MAAGLPRALGGARGVRSVPERRRRAALVALALCAVASAATLGSRAFAAGDVPLSAETGNSVRGGTPDAAQASAGDARQPSEDSTSDARTDAGSVIPVPPLDQPVVDDLVRALAQDSIRWNAGDAVHKLLHAGPDVRDELERALASPDEQQRHLAAYVLRHRDDSSAPALFEASVEALGRVWFAGYHETLIHRPAVDAFRWLVSRGAEPAVFLRRGLDSADGQRQLLCAYLLARSGAEASQSVVARVLVEHLGDNHIQGDAVLSANGLWLMGQRSLGDIRYARRWADRQALALLDLIELDLLDEQDGRVIGYPERRARYERLGLRSVTEVYIDPVRDFDPLRSSVPQF